MNKEQARAAVWSELIKVAEPDSRFHLNFNEYIPDFQGSDAATQRLIATDFYRQAETIFITPDNCLEQFRAQVVRDGKTQVMSTYGIRRGFVELKPEDVEPGLEEYVVLLDAIEKAGRYVSLAELQARYHFDLIVTGASAVSTGGIRFGKGHGFFDLEWATFYQLGSVDQSTPIVAFVHDCQVVDIDLQANRFDTLCDYIVTPTRTLHIANPQKPAAGIIWDRLEPEMMEMIPHLQELREMLDSPQLA